MCALGMHLSYPSCLLPALRQPDSEIKADLNIGSWLSSCVGLASIPGNIIASCFMALLGRRLTHGLLILPGLIGCILIYQATSVTMLMVGRILAGITSGATVPLGAIVVGEYTSPKNRGMFLNLKTAMVCLGSMIIHILGNYMHWRMIAMTILIPHIVSILIIISWPESPAWLASKKEFKKCEESFFWLMGKDKNSVIELQKIIQAQKSDLNKDLKYKDAVIEFFRKFTKKNFLKPLRVFTVGAVVMEASGRHIFPAYALDIFYEVSGDKSHSYYYTLGIDIIITASSTFSSFLIRIYPRRTLLFSTGFASIAAVIIACGYLFLTSRGIITEFHSAIPMGLFMVYFIVVNLGCTPIPIALLGELFPLVHRAVGALLSGLIMSILVYVGLHITPYLLIMVKVYGTFMIFGVITGLCLLLLYFVLPETKDRTLQEIEDYFNYGKFRDEADEEIKGGKKKEMSLKIQN